VAKDEDIGWIARQEFSRGRTSQLVTVADVD
jgi:hypothetical protein